MLLGIQVQPQQGGRGQIFCAEGIVTPSLFSTAAGVSGPLLWNGSTLGGGRGVTAYLLALSYGLTVASTVSGAIGLTGATGQIAAPTTTTAISSVGNLNIGGPAPQCTAYSVGTVTNAGTFFMPTGHAHTGAVTVDTDDDNFIHLGGAVTVTPTCWAAVVASAVLTSAVMQVGLIWMEVPND